MGIDEPAQEPPAESPSNRVEPRTVSVLVGFYGVILYVRSGTTATSSAASVSSW